MKLITRAWTFIENDSADGRLTKCKLLGRTFRNAPSADVEDYLYKEAEKSQIRLLIFIQMVTQDLNCSLLMPEKKVRLLKRVVCLCMEKQFLEQPKRL